MLLNSNLNNYLYRGEEGEYRGEYWLGLYDERNVLWNLDYQGTKIVDKKMFALKGKLTKLASKLVTPGCNLVTRVSNLVMHQRMMALLVYNAGWLVNRTMYFATLPMDCTLYYPTLKNHRKNQINLWFCIWIGCMMFTWRIGWWRSSIVSWRRWWIIRWRWAT